MSFIEKLGLKSFTTSDGIITTKEYTGHDCVVYIINPINPIEAIVAGYNCNEFGKYGFGLAILDDE